MRKKIKNFIKTVTGAGIMTLTMYVCAIAYTFKRRDSGKERAHEKD